MSSPSKTVEQKANIKNGIARMVFSMLAILLQVVWILVLVRLFSDYAQWVSLAVSILALILALAIYSQDKTASLKVPWIILIMAFPLMGVTLYLLVGMSRSTKKMRQRYADVDRILFSYLSQDEDTVRRFEEYDEGLSGISRYLHNVGGYPVYSDTDIAFYPEAAEGLEAQKEELRRARKFIFMEYYAIEDKEAWKGVFDILEQKVREGVEVRLFYDDIGSIAFINKDFVERMENAGIQCKVFNPVSPVLNMFMNNRDHRKFMVIDGKIAFTGGYNLANEYFGITEPYGKWKDTGVRLEGEAVRTLTVLFLEMWNAVSKHYTPDPGDIGKYFTEFDHTAGKGFVQPYGDNPMGNEHIGENVYISMVEKSRRYCYFTTPYLIITDEMNHAMGLAAKRGVDVRIITPGIPDKKVIYRVTRSYYPMLVKNGVRIYEYTPGFCHAKQCVVDDRAATCGTINLDYRSLYHHFEDGCLFADCDAVAAVKQDFEDMFPICREVTDKYRNRRFVPHRLGQLLLRVLAALM